MLERAYKLRENIKDFIASKGENTDEFENPQFIADFAFLVDLTSRLNKLNKKMQGTGRFACDSYDQITSKYALMLPDEHSVLYIAAHTE